MYSEETNGNAGSILQRISDFVMAPHRRSLARTYLQEIQRILPLPIPTAALRPYYDPGFKINPADKREKSIEDTLQVLQDHDFPLRDYYSPDRILNPKVIIIGEKHNENNDKKEKIFSHLIHKFLPEGGTIYTEGTAKKIHYEVDWRMMFPEDNFFLNLKDLMEQRKIKFLGNDNDKARDKMEPSQAWLDSNTDSVISSFRSGNLTRRAELEFNNHAATSIKCMRQRCNTYAKSLAESKEPKIVQIMGYMDFMWEDIVPSYLREHGVSYLFFAQEK